jgi:hypothetical protein
LLLGPMIGPAPFPAEAAPADLTEAELADSEASRSDNVIGHTIRGLDFHVWDDVPQEATNWAAELLGAGAGRLEEARWRSIARRSATLPPALSDGFEAQLRLWARATAGPSDPSALGCILCLLPSLDRTVLISSWATSPDASVRLALARALSAPFEAVGVPSALRELQGDPRAEIRRAARFAAASRRAPAA